MKFFHSFTPPITIYRNADRWSTYGGVLFALPSVYMRITVHPIFS